MVKYFEQGASMTAVSWADVGRFFKSVPNVLKSPRDTYLGGEKISTTVPPTLMGSRSTIVLVDFGFVVSRIGIFQKRTKRLIGTLKRLFGPEKIFATMTTVL